MTQTAHERVAELQACLEAKEARANEIIASDGITIEGKNMHIPTDLLDEVKGLYNEGQEIKMLIEATKMGKSVDEFKSEFGQYPGGASAAMAAAAGAELGGGPSIKSLGEAFTESEEFKALLRSGGSTMQTPFELDAKDITSYGTFDQKDIFTGLLTGATNPRGFGRVQFDPAVPRGQRQARVRDLFNVATTSANLIDYFRVLGFAEGGAGTPSGGEGNAGTVRERAAANGTSAPAGNNTDTFGLKPKSNLIFQSAQAPVRTIAHWEAAHRNVLSDEPQLQATINNELLYGLALEEDFQIMQGDGTNENLLGVLNQPYTQSYNQTNASNAATEPMSDALRRAATKALVANYPATGFVLNPFDWEKIELQKDGEGRYMLITNVVVGAEARIWRQPVIETVAMPEHKFVTGAWGIGAQLYDRQVANVRIAEQHADFFVRNALAILVEERLAFAMKRPEAFVIGNFFVPTP